jgi:hypothetical protein
MSRCWLTLILLLAMVRGAVAAPAHQWVVVTAPAFRAAIGPLCAQRRAQGLHVVVVQTTDVLTPREVRAGAADKLRARVHELCRAHRGPTSVLLVGAVEPGGLEQPEGKVVPALAGSAGRMEGQPSDNGYGCPGGGRLPTAAVGRFPARTEEEARSMVRKTLELERDTRPGPWRRRLTVLAGIPAYNPLVDRMVEGLALARLSRIDPSWTGRALYSNPASRFCVPDRLLRARALQYVQEGQAFTLYLGHSSAEGLYGGRARYLDRDDWARLRISRGAGVLVTFGCLGCRLNGEDGEGYGVAAIRNPHGPAAVIGSHGICFAAMVQLAADGLFESTFAGRVPERLGTSWLALKTGLARGPIDDLTYRVLDAVDGDGRIPQATQRQEHLEMFVLLGDPALRLPDLPADVNLQVSGPPAPGQTVTVSGTASACLAGARVRVILERPVNSIPPDLEMVPAEPGPVRERVLLANHERANDFSVALAEAVVRDGRFEARLSVPARLPCRRLTLRAYAATEQAEGQGVLTLDVPGTEGPLRGSGGRCYNPGKGATRSRSRGGRP